MNRRSVLRLSAGVLSNKTFASEGSASASASFVRSGEDRSHQPHNMGITINNFKVLSRETGGGLFTLEQTFHERGGPPRHLHPQQDEWFYAVEGTFQFEIGDDRFTLNAGDSILAPRNVPHVWACIGTGKGKILVSFAPAGKMEAFFERIAASRSMPPQTPELWTAYGMQLLGPPLQI